MIRTQQRQITLPIGITKQESTISWPPTLQFNCELHGDFDKTHEKAENVGNTPLPTLCISGFACSLYNFSWIAPFLAAKNPLVLVDNRGMGKSQGCSWPYSLVDLADDAATLMNSLGFTRYNIVGISMGGMIAQLLTLKYPEQVSKLALLCTTSGGSRFAALPEITVEALKLFYSFPEPKRSASALKSYVHPSLLVDNPELFQRMIDLRSSQATNLDQVLLQKYAVDEFLLSEIPIQNIHCPSLILTGADDRFVPIENARRLAQLIPQAKLEIIPNSDHFFFLEKAKDVAASIQEFITDKETKIYEPLADLN